MAYPCVCSLWFKGIFFLNVRENGTGSCQSKNVELPGADPVKWCQFLYWSPFLSVPSLGLFVQVLIIWIPKPTPLCSDFKRALSAQFSFLNACVVQLCSDCAALQKCWWCLGKASLLQHLRAWFLLTCVEPAWRFSFIHTVMEPHASAASFSDLHGYNQTIIPNRCLFHQGIYSCACNSFLFLPFFCSGWCLRWLAMLLSLY